ncbi:unnamed protein product [Microthlaspi erraticum]|uniref:Uncharacterized protein n=1 Tax=Microthlaspi erraticum TaxID=1685480 RepID=A0A6D2JG08_9BRAS|nr:unnamed protein product [Microthlaspi erraticum]
MAKISFFLFALVLIASLHAYEAHRVGRFLEEDLKAKKTSDQGLPSQVETLSNSEQMPSAPVLAPELAPTLAPAQAPSEKKLKKFNRLNIRRSPARNKKPASIIQSILKDFGLNGGRN